MESQIDTGVSAIMLAGTHLWKSTSLDALLPRALVPIANAPLVAYVTGWLVRGRITEAAICVNNATALFRKCLGDGSQLGLDLHYYEDRVPRGPAGSAADAAAIHKSQRYVVVDATIIPTVDPLDLLRAHIHGGAAATIVVVDHHDGAVRFDEPPRPVGIYVLERRVFEHVPPTGYQDIKETLIPRLHQAGEQVLAYQANTAAPRIGGLESYFAANAWALGQIPQTGRPPREYERVAETWIHRSARVAPDVSFHGPVLIGRDTVVDRGALIVGPTVIGSRCSIGARSLVARSVLWDECVVGSAVRVDRMLLPTGSSIQSATLTDAAAGRPGRPRSWSIFRQYLGTGRGESVRVHGRVSVGGGRRQ